METLELLDRCPDIVLVSNDVEQLLYAYLDLYHSAKEGTARATVEFVASMGLRSVFEILHSDFIARNMGHTDVLLAAQYRKTMSAWAETRWLFWLQDSLRLSTQSNYRRIWLVSSSDLALVRPAAKAGLIPIGRAGDGDLDVPFPFERLDVDSSAWTLHSDQDSLSQVIRELQKSARVVLFHNFARRLKKFAERAGLPCDVLGPDPINV
jgi:hypothetical protein